MHTHDEHIELLSPFSPTFLRCPSGAPGSARVSVIGVPSEALSCTGTGAATGPVALRVCSDHPGYFVDPCGGQASGWFDCYTGSEILSGVSFTDAGDVIIPHGESACELGRRVCAVVDVCNSAASFPLLLGGDHSITYWSVQALAKQPVCVIHLDAHSDLAELSNTGHHCNASVARALLGLSGVHSLTTVGLRGILPVQQHELRQGHKLITVREIKQRGVETILNQVPTGIPCYVSLDVDVLDPSVAPATNTPEPDGLTFQELREILAKIGNERQVVGADVVEINATNDRGLYTAKVATRLILSLLAACLK